METMMKDTNETGIGGGNVALGRLEEVKSFGIRPKLAIGLPCDFPVLTFPLRAAEALCVSANYRHANFGFGHMELEDGRLMTMRLQLGGVQFYWLAEMTDPELWAAIDMWKRAKRVLFGLKIENGNAWNIKFGATDVGIGRLTAEKYRDCPRRVATAHDWHAMTSLVTGFVQMRATTDIPGVPLQHVFASALLTSQFEEVAHERPLIEKPVIVKAPLGTRILV
jgi:hypothetical protein